MKTERRSGRETRRKATGERDAKTRGEKQGKSMPQCYAFAEVQSFQTTCGCNKAQEVTVVSGMLKCRH